jgi:hypothetical protein
MFPGLWDSRISWQYKCGKGYYFMVDRKQINTEQVTDRGLGQDTVPKDMSPSGLFPHSKAPCFTISQKTPSARDQAFNNEPLRAFS